jgi:hypothetical protein
MPGMSGLSEDEMSAKACDPAWAIPTFATWMQGNFAWAQEQIALTGSLATIDFSNPKVPAAAKNPYWLATLAYNRGKTGALEEVNSGTVVPHPDHVSHLTNHFCDVAKIPHLMPDV